MDPVRWLEKEYNKNGWPFYLIVDGKGEVVYGKSTLVSRDEGEISGILDQVAPGKPLKLTSYNGTDYLATTARKNKIPRNETERFPCLVSNKKGELFLSYVTDHKGGNQVRLRTVESGQEVVVSEGLEDPYFATSIVDGSDRIWTFISALSDQGRYELFARHYSAEKGLSDSEQLTDTNDDAMHPDAAVDAEGNVWVAYYRWLKMGTSSRDKEIFARYFDGEDWLTVLRLSPEDVPAYEDHTDPSIAPDPEVGVCIAWSWDMHPLDIDRYKHYQSTYHAENPTIFGRRASAEDDEEELLFFGQQAIDAAPELYLASDRRLWCAWNTLGNGRGGAEKSLVLSVTGSGKDERSEQYIVQSNAQDICTPRFIEHDGSLNVFFSSQNDDVWTLKRSILKDGAWAEPAVIENMGDPRYASLARSGDGRIWLACSMENGAGRKIVLKELEEQAE